MTVRDGEESFKIIIIFLYQVSDVAIFYPIHATTQPGKNTQHVKGPIREYDCQSKKPMEARVKEKRTIISKEKKNKS